MGQVLYEPRFIDKSAWEKKKYVNDKWKSWKDAKGNVLPEYEERYKTYSLTYVLSQCPDFKKMRSLHCRSWQKTSRRHGVKIEVLLTPKYHCELAGEGILEYAWGLAKKTFRWIPHKDKKGKAEFHAGVETSLYSVTVQQIRKFSARCRRYMLTYQLLDGNVSNEDATKAGVSYDVLELYYVNTKMKTYWCTASQESSFIAKEWRKAQGVQETVEK